MSDHVGTNSYPLTTNVRDEFVSYFRIPQLALPTAANDADTRYIPPPTEATTNVDGSGALLLMMKMKSFAALLNVSDPNTGGPPASIFTNTDIVRLTPPGFATDLYAYDKVAPSWPKANPVVTPFCHQKDDAAVTNPALADVSDSPAGNVGALNRFAADET
jgi:hypothetical protein